MWNDERKNRDGEVIAEGLCGMDGRVHPQYTTFVPATGRWASKNPNSQNYSIDLRYIFEPEEGHVFLMADYDQIELRLFCSLAKVQGYLDVFKATPENPFGGDPHAMTAMLIYGKKFEAEMLAAMTPTQRLNYELTGIPQKVSGSSTYELLRVFAKTFVYCIIYGGTDDTVFLSVSSATYPEGTKDKHGNDLSGKLIFPDMTRREVAVAFNVFLRNAKEIPAYWEKVEEFCKRNRFVAEPLLNRRRDFLEFDRNGALNHGIQSGAFQIAATGLLNLRRVFVPDFKKKTGIVNMMHDSFTIEVEEDRCEAMVKPMEKAINLKFVQVPGMDFSSEADITINWRGKPKKGDLWVPPAKRIVDRVDP
jgi:DNA polymerase I-like protein with 3'-5' exonuclease and polymerase domains